MWHAWGRGEMFTGFWLGGPKVRDHWEELCLLPFSSGNKGENIQIQVQYAEYNSRTKMKGYRGRETEYKTKLG
jgi:hypothetical protein